MSQQFCLKWNNHTTNMLSVFENLLSTEALVDVTLACDGLSLKAHKMVLSACSPFFQSLFLENPCKHPIVIMKDMRYTDLKAIIDFMYRGEVNVSHDQLSALLKTAETLKVKGLAEVSGENRHASGIVQQEITQQNITIPTSVPPPTSRSETPPMHGKRKRGRPRKRSLSDSNRSDEDQVPSKIKEPDSPEIEELSGDASLEAMDIRQGSNSSHSQSQVPVHQTSSNTVNSFSHKSHSMMPSMSDAQVEEPPSGDDGDFEVEPSKLLEQTLTTDNVPAMSNSQASISTIASTGHLPLPSSSGLEISQRSMGSTDSQALVPVSIASDSLSSSHLQGPDSPQDIKPAILTFEEPPISPVAGPSHQSDRSMMMYMDQSGVASIPGPSNYQDSQSLVQHDSQPQGKRTLWWNQRMRLQRLQTNVLPRHLKHKSIRFARSALFKGGVRQAVCPFCYKAFYDKSTMNRHVSKQVCLGLNYRTPSQGDDFQAATSNEVSFDEPAASSESPPKTELEPCPFCKKLLKGQRGLRKHLDFYGCPMAVSLRNEDNENLNI